MTIFGFRPASEVLANAMAWASVGMVPSNQPLCVPVSFRVIRETESPLELETLTINSSYLLFGCGLDRLLAHESDSPV